MSRSLTINGSGMAGLGLLKQLRALDDSRRVTLISADSGADYSKPLLSSSFAKGFAPERLAMRSALEVSDQLDAVVRTHTRVERLDPLERCLWIGEERLAYDELVLATGATPRMPFKIPATVANRVFSVNDLDDYRRLHGILNELARPAHVLIVGAGLVGCEFANDLRAGGHTVSLMAPESTPLPRLLPEPLGRVLGEVFNAAGIELHLGRVLERLADTGSQVSVKLDDGSSLKVDLVLLATGLRPRTELAEAAGLSVTAAGIQVDRLLTTSTPGIYALGDVACVDGVNAMYVPPLQAGAKALARTLTGTPTELRYRSEEHTSELQSRPHL